jgi:ribonuclease P/MRP protein subunit RPP1
MKLKKISDKAGLSGGDHDGYLLDANEKEARKIIQSIRDLKLKGRTIVAILGGEDQFNRRIIETLKVDYLVSPERGEKRDSLKQRDSGLNHVVAKEAKKNNIKIIIDFNELKKLKGKEKSIRLSRIIQNVKICRKAKCPIKIWDLSNKTDETSLKAFGASVGMSSEQTRDCIKL